jgi:hypothetical protein
MTHNDFSNAIFYVYRLFKSNNIPLFFFQELIVVLIQYYPPTNNNRIRIPLFLFCVVCATRVRKEDIHTGILIKNEALTLVPVPGTALSTGWIKKVYR